MFTVCPKCALALSVAASDLRAGQGYVRCGRCANVFNALLALTDEATTSATVHPPSVPQERRRDTRPPESAPPDPPAMAPPAAGPPEPDPPAPAPPATHSPPLQAAAPSPPPPPAAKPNVPDELEVEEFRGTGTFETIVLEGDTFLQTEEQVAEEEVDIELADVSRRIEAARDAGDLAQINGVTVEVEEEEQEEEEEEEETIEKAEPAQDVVRELLPARQRPSALGIAAAALLVLLLAAQGINHWRNDLATYSAWYGPLSRLSAATGIPLRPNWDLSAYDVRQLGASTDAADPRALKVRLSLANRGLRSQALPLVRLSLLDRYGTVVSSGDLQPAEYLPAALRGERFIASEQRIDTEVSVVDPTQQVSSFELDVCVAAASGGLRCAGDTPVLGSRK